MTGAPAAAVRLSAAARRALAPLERDWRLAPPCFAPGPLAIDLSERELIEIAGEPGAYRLRLTGLGAELRDCEGEG